MTIDMLKIAKVLHGMKQQTPANVWNEMVNRFEFAISESCQMLSLTQEEGVLADFRKVCLTGRE